MIPNIIGLIGVSLIVIAYFFVQIGHLKAETILFSALNAIGSGGILFSLFFDWNLSAAIVEFLWFIISLFGCFKKIFSP